METAVELEVLNDDLLGQFEKILSIAAIIFNEEKILYFNGICKRTLGYEESSYLKDGFSNLENFSEDEDLKEYVRGILEKPRNLDKVEMKVFGKNKREIWVEFRGKVILYNNQKSIFAQLIDITEKKNAEFNLSRLSKLRDLMLEVTQSILETEDIDHMLELILTNSLKAFEKSALGTILVKEDDYFKVAASIGFADGIEDFKLLAEESFLSKATNGKMNRIVNIGDLSVYDNYYSFTTVFGEEKFIKSTLTAPIFIKGSLFGTINIDSIDTNGFDQEDFKTMEFIRSNVEIAVSNHISYKEKAFLANFDSLTNLYNRYYFEENFNGIKDKAIRYNDFFKLVLFDIDDLKVVNDCMGHLAGDQVIKKFAEELKNTARKSDVIARLGGDEFIGIFFYADEDKLSEKFQGVLAKLEREEEFLDNQSHQTSFSYGIASYPEEGQNLEELIKIADKRMYEQKSKKKWENRRVEGNGRNDDKSIFGSNTNPL